MMPLLLLVPQTNPEWLSTVIAYLSGGLICGLLLWGMILEFRYTGPYTIVKLDNREKWRRAVILALINTTPFPILGLTVLTLNLHSDRWLMPLQLCGGLWVVAIPIVILYERWEFEREIKRYQWLDRMMKTAPDFYRHVVLSGPLNRLVDIFMTAEQKRFSNEGYSHNMVNSEGNEPHS